MRWIRDELLSIMRGLAEVERGRLAGRINFFWMSGLLLLAFFGGVTPFFAAIVRIFEPDYTTDFPLVQILIVGT